MLPNKALQLTGSSTFQPPSGYFGCNAALSAGHRAPQLSARCVRRDCEATASKGRTMTPFEYLSVLVAIIVGLGMTHLLVALGQLIQSRDDQPIYWVQVA